jgi:hypothetical protein
VVVKSEFFSLHEAIKIRATKRGNSLFIGYNFAQN